MEIGFGKKHTARTAGRLLNAGEKALVADLEGCDVFKPGEVQSLGLLSAPKKGRSQTRNMRKQGGFATFGTVMTLGGLGLLLLGKGSALKVAGGMLMFAGLHEQRWERGEDIHAGGGDIHSGRSGNIHGGGGDIHSGRSGNIHGGGGDIHSGRSGNIHGGGGNIHRGYSDIH